MLLIGAHRGVGVEILAGERVRQLGLTVLQVVEVCVIGQQIENEGFHDATSPTLRSAGRARIANSAVATAAMTANTMALRNTCRGASPCPSRNPPSGAAAMPPSRPMPSAQPMPLVRMRAG